MEALSKGGTVLVSTYILSPEKEQERVCAWFSFYLDIRQLFLFVLSLFANSFAMYRLHLSFQACTNKHSHFLIERLREQGLSNTKRKTRCTLRLVGLKDFLGAADVVLKRSPSWRLKIDSSGYEHPSKTFQGIGSILIVEVSQSSCAATSVLTVITLLQHMVVGPETYLQHRVSVHAQINLLESISITT